MRSTASNAGRNGTIEAALGRIAPPDAKIAREVARRLDEKTKPRGSLGRLEELACRLGAIRGAVPDHVLAPAIVVAAADHGVASAGVSAYPREVTRQMLANFSHGGAAVCVLAHEVGARLVVVDAGVDGAPLLEGVRDAAVPGIRGTQDFTRGPAMERATAVALIERGLALSDELADEGIEIVALGEMGIGNSTAASALAATLLPAPPEEVCGPGTGLDAAGVDRKIEVVRGALDVNGFGGEAVADPLDALARVGGLEIAFLVGVLLGAAGRRLPVLLDGFISGAAALVAGRLEPRAIGSTIAGTRSPEPGHALILAALELEPLLDLGIRLGEGAGAALALPLVRAAVSVLLDMSTFSTAGVADREEHDAVPARAGTTSGA